MKFLHTADWHFGKRLRDFPLVDVQREALASIIAIVEREGPDAVVVAGDVFDTQIPQLAALDLWETAVDTIVGDLGVPMVVIPGNHDHPERLALHSGLAKRAGLHIVKGVTGCVEPVRIGGVSFHCLPFHKPVHVNSAWRGAMAEVGDFDYDGAMRGALSRIARSSGDGPAVLVAHAFVAGSGDEGEAEDSVQVGGAGAVNPSCFGDFDYVALGHIHGHRALGTRDHVHYAGSPYKYSFDECHHEKTVTMVELDEGGSVRTDRIPVPASRDVRVIDGLTFEEVLADAATVPAERRADYLLVKVTDRDPIPDALARLRDAYPNALLEKQANDVVHTMPKLRGDYRTIQVEDAFRQFYEHVMGSPIDGIEEELLLEVLHGDEERDDVAVDDDETTMDVGARDADAPATEGSEVPDEARESEALA